MWPSAITHTVVSKTAVSMNCYVGLTCSTQNDEPAHSFELCTFRIHKILYRFVD